MHGRGVGSTGFVHIAAGKVEQIAGGQGAIKGFSTGLAGQKVGSRVMLVVPPKDGYGKQGSGEIKGTDTMVFVIDILGAA